MIISMQGHWKVTVKSKSASYDQQFVVSGASIGNGTYQGTPGITANVYGKQWTIAIRNNPGTGFRLSKTKIMYPKKVSGNYQFEILSEDAGDGDFNDLILTCSTPININNFIIYGNATLYSGLCIFNPCYWRGPLIIDTYYGLLESLKNPILKKAIEQLYSERIPEIIPDPPPPEPFEHFKPIVIDLFNEATQPKTALVYKRIEDVAAKKTTRGNAEEQESEFAANQFTLLKSTQQKVAASFAAKYYDHSELLRVIDQWKWRCRTEPAKNITLTFEEYDRTAAELAGGPYTGTGNRQLLGDTITDMYGNYIFHFTFDMEFPGIADSTDIAIGESINVVAYPDVIVKVTGYSPYEVLYESAPYYNIPNLKRINLCLPKRLIPTTSTCFNGNLLGSLGNVFIGGSQNTAASTAATALRRYGYSNNLEEDGKISVGSSLANFNIECAAWGGVIDMKGCMYDTAKSATDNKIEWYTVRIKRAGTSNWEFVSQNYKHPMFSKRYLDNYIGDDVGPFEKSLKVDGGTAVKVPAYINIQRRIFADGEDWEFSDSDRYMQLNTGLYDRISGIIEPGTFYVRVDGYDGTGKMVPGATDMVALYIHNRPLNFDLSSITFTDPSIIKSDCNLYRLKAADMNTSMQFTFRANDPDGFVHSYLLAMGRCPEAMLALKIIQPNPPLSDTPTGASVLSQGNATGNVHHDCPGYTGTMEVFGTSGSIKVEFQPAPSEGGWIRTGEYFSRLYFALSAYKRVTNGYNTGLSGKYHIYRDILIERFSE